MPIFKGRIWPRLLWPLAQIYGGIVGLRNALYDRQLLKVESPPCRVISVGNLTAGGSGKTPATLFLAQQLRDRGQKVAVVSRGYKRRGGGTRVVCDGTRILATVAEAGDEPYLMARRLNGVVVIVDKNRGRAIRMACERFGTDVVLLDDGFQYRCLARDEDHVLISAESLFGNELLLPAGLLREPLSSLRRSSQVWITKVRDPAEVTAIVDRLRTCTEAPIRLAAHVPTCFERWPQGERVSLSAVQAKKVYCLCGIAEPLSFLDTVAALGARVVGSTVLGDHCKYGTRRFRRIIGRARAAGAEMLVTTEKDAVKFPTIGVDNLAVLSLVIDFVPYPQCPDPQPSEGEATGSVAVP